MPRRSRGRGEYRTAGVTFAELETFRIDEETAQQFFFAYLGVRDLTARRPDVLAVVNRNPMFWRTMHYSMFVSTFIWLGRMFDQQSAHNVNLLLRMIERNLPTLNRDALRDRKAKVITPEQAAEYVASKHEMTIDDVRALRKDVADWRRIYEPVYRHIRDHLARNKKGVSDLDALLAITNIEEMKRMFGFFHALHEGLVELYLNGRTAAAGCHLRSAAGPQAEAAVSPRREGLPRGTGRTAVDAAEGRLDRCASCRDPGDHIRFVPVIACAFADEELKAMFTKFFPNDIPGGKKSMLGRFGSISSLFARIQFALAFDMTHSDVLLALDKLRGHRNDIAHTWDQDKLADFMEIPLPHGRVGKRFASPRHPLGVNRLGL